jgi:hypothetical protein
MSEFDARSFMRAQFEPRTAAVPVPALKQFFGDDEPAWTVRGMTASEMARSMEAASRHKTLDAVVQALSSNKAKIEELREALGMSDEVPGEIAKRLEQLATCSVAPVADLQLAVKLSTAYPVEFYQLTNKIVELTGLGMDVKKPPTSGETAPSET